MVNSEINLLRKFIGLMSKGNYQNLEQVAGNMNLSISSLFDQLISWSNVLPFRIEQDSLVIDSLIGVKKKLNNLIKGKKLKKKKEIIIQGAKRYQGIQVLEKEYRVLRKIEEIIGTPIVPSQRQNWVGGFVSENGHIVLLGIEYKKKLKHLPDSIGNFVFLEKLVLRHNNINSIPNSIGNLSKLSYLHLGYNNLTSIPDSIGKLEYLKTLQLNDNLLKDFPKSISNLINLNFLTISRNNLNIGRTFRILNSIKQKGCEIERIQAFSWTAVKNEGIICNSGQEQENFIDKLFNMDEFLSFEESCAKMFKKKQEDQRFLEHEGMKKFDVDLEEKEEEIPKYDDLSWAMIYQDKPIIKDDYDVLIFLEQLFKTPIPSIKSSNEGFGFVAEDGRVIELGLSFTKLKKLPQAIILLSNLKALFLGNNNLTSIPDWIKSFSELESLNVQKNNLFTLTDAIGTLENLKSLDLSNNKLILIPDSMIDLFALKYLNLENNQLNFEKSEKIINMLRKNGCEIQIDRTFKIGVTQSMPKDDWRIEKKKLT